MLQNVIRVRMRVLFFMLIVSMFSGCTTPYDPPIIASLSGQNDSPFPGLKQYAAKGDMRVLWIHGMCNHTEKWAIKRQKLLTSTLQSTVTSAISSADHPSYKVDEPFDVVFHSNYQGSDIETRYLIWSPATKPAKNRLVFDSEQLDFKRASLNQKLKSQLMNDCLADAVAYIGKPGDSIRRWAKAEVCKAMNGYIAKTGACVVSKTLNQQVVFISESLGSKMLSDALEAVWEDANTSSKSMLSSNLSQVQMVFVVANQIPIIDVAEYSPSSTRFASGNEKYSGFQILADARMQTQRAKAKSLAPLRFVEFTDPNDVLSYRLVGSWDVNPDVAVSNVIVSNGPTYAGMLENPLTAHCGYQWNPYVMGTIFEGYQGGAVSKISLMPKKQNCL